MLPEALDKLKYPIGKFSKPEIIFSAVLAIWIQEIKNFPNILSLYCKDLNKEQLNWVYRPGGWTIKQVVHHCADSHMNSYIRFKLCLTEEQPVIRPYYEDRWAELEDGKDDDLSDSLALLNALHNKWGKLLDRLSNSDLDKEFIHPANGQKYSLRENIGIYAWHSQHHLAHVKQALLNKGQF